jgi:GNAT superfamily N-acetyltransferase
MRGGDEPYIFSRWLKSYSRSSWAKAVGTAYWQQHHKLVERLMRDTTVLVAGWAEDDNVIAGFACGDSPTTVHYVWVETEWRGRGVARRLIEQVLGVVARDVVCTHDSRRALPEGWRYDPYVAFGKAG